MALQNTFFYCSKVPGTAEGLEEATILEMIARHNNAVAINLYTLLAHTPDAAMRSSVRSYINNGTCYALPSVPAHRLQDFADKITFLSKDTTAGALPVVLQAAAVIGHRLTRYDKQVATFARYGVSGLSDLVKKEEMDKQDFHYFMLRDRLSRGGTMADEALAARILKEIHSYALCPGEPMPPYAPQEIYSTPRDRHLIFLYKMMPGEYARHHDRVIMDNLLSREDEKHQVAIISPDDVTTDQKINVARLYTDGFDKGMIKTSLEYEKRYELGAQVYDDQTHLWVSYVRFVGEDGQQLAPFDLAASLVDPFA